MLTQISFFTKCLSDVPLTDCKYPSFSFNHFLSFRFFSHQPVFRSYKGVYAGTAEISVLVF